MRLPRFFEAAIEVEVEVTFAEAETLTTHPWRALGCPVVEQEETEWCWASIGQAVRKFHRPANALRQCDVAAKMKRPLLCCGVDRKDCNEGDTLAGTLDELGHLRSREAPMIFEDIYREITEAGAPIGCFIDYDPPQIDHFALIIAAGKVDGRDCVGVVDPLPGREHTTPVEYELSAFKKYQKGTWAEAYPTKKA